MKLGSLFDGSGGFPLAGALCGVTPAFASEVEPYPIAVTTSRFPTMKHLGSVTDINGAEIEPVDIITFGSPCQDLSVAGKRAGLKHEANGDEETTRSGLFMEAVRIIKEMRRATNGLYPTFAVWENVPGAFSSNRGEDFRIVLEELIKIVEPGAVMPTVPQKGWAYADSYCGDGWSLAYRTLDAQYWGVPQRRRRIYLVLDLRGERAHKVLFEREGLRGYFTEGRAPWKATARNAENCPGADDYQGNSIVECRGGLDAVGLTNRGFCSGDKAETLRAESHGALPMVCMATQQGGAEIRTDDKAPTITAAAGMSGNNQPVVCYPNVAHALTARHDGSPQPDKGNGANIVVQAAGFKAGQSMAGGIGWQEETAATLSAQCSGTEPTVCTKTWDARGNGDGDTCNTLTGDHENRITDYTSVVCEPIPIHDQTTRFSGKRGDKSDGKGNGLGVGAPGDPMNTLTSGDRHAVAFAVNPASFYPQMKAESQCFRTDGVANTIVNGTNPGFQNGIVQPVAYTMQGFGDYKDCGVASGLKARDYKDATDLVAEAQPIVLDRAFFNQGQNAQYDPQFYTDGTVPTLVARGPSAVAHKAEIRYIVRRLTPTECARLQGFPDTWGHINHKENLTDEEYSFWLEVRNTHAAINGKATKEYTKEQMLTWYSKLHTDSAEYKMWGNGIALPTALYVMQGIADALE